MVTEAIVNGPSKWDLMLAIFDSTSEKPRRVTFVLHDGRRIEMNLVAISREDGSGESWCFEGLVRLSDGECERLLKGYFATRDRRGTLWF